MAKYVSMKIIEEKMGYKQFFAFKLYLRYKNAIDEELTKAGREDLIEVI